MTDHLAEHRTEILYCYCLADNAHECAELCEQRCNPPEPPFQLRFKPPSQPPCDCSCHKETAR